MAARLARQDGAAIRTLDHLIVGGTHVISFVERSLI
jgi:DNA repair protein RadC